MKWRQRASKNVVEAVVAAFRDPAEYIGQALELAGDSVTQSQIAAAFGRVLNRQISYFQIPLAVLEQQQPALA